jgi:SAM-dependent methyltransferase
MSLIAASRNRVRQLLLLREKFGEPRLTVWPEARRASDPGSFVRVCNICGWHGADFVGAAHSEGAQCPVCGAIARDRFLYWCWTKRVPYSRGQRVLETSPRLDQRYRNRMASLVTYTASDYDESAHKATLKLDLQDLALPDASLDVVLTPHVLEHVPDTGRALSELYRVLSPGGGSLMLMIPMPQGRTAPPVVEEFHGDNTLVYWRFGWDLRDQLEAAGFTVTCLVTQDLIDRLTAGQFSSGWPGTDVDEVDLLSQADAGTLTPVADEREARRYGFHPDLHFILWHCQKPGGPTTPAAS